MKIDFGKECAIESVRYSTKTTNTFPTFFSSNLCTRCGYRLQEGRVSSQTGNDTASCLTARIERWEFNLEETFIFQFKKRFLLILLRFDGKYLSSALLSLSQEKKVHYNQLFLKKLNSELVLLGCERVDTPTRFSFVFEEFCGESSINFSGNVTENISKMTVLHLLRSGNTLTEQPKKIPKKSHMGNSNLMLEEASLRGYLYIFERKSSIAESKDRKLRTLLQRTSWTTSRVSKTAQFVRTSGHLEVFPIN